MKMLFQAHILLLSLGLTFFSLNAKAQTIDSLKLDTLITVLSLEKEDIRTVNAYLSLCNEYVGVTDYSIALTYANLAKDLSHKIGHDRGELDANFQIAHIYLAYYMDFQTAAEYYDQAHEIVKRMNSDRDLIEVYRGYAAVYAFTHKYQVAIAFNQEAIKLAERMGDYQLISDLNAYGGNMYEELGDTANAIKMYKEVERIEEENNYLNTTFGALTTIAHYHFLEGDFEESLRLYRSAIKRFERMQDFRWTSYAHAEIANVYMVDGQLKKAEKHALAGLEIAQKYELNKERSDNYYVLSNVYLALGDEENSRKYQDAYQALQDSVQVDVKERKFQSQFDENELNASKSSLWSGFLNSLIIVAFTILAVVIGGMVRRNR